MPVQVYSDIVICSCIVGVGTDKGARLQKVFLVYVHQGETRNSVHRKNFFAPIVLGHILEEHFGSAHDHGSEAVFVSVAGLGCPFSS